MELYNKSYSWKKPKDLDTEAGLAYSPHSRNSQEVEAEQASQEKLQKMGSLNTNFHLYSMIGAFKE